MHLLVGHAEPFLHHLIGFTDHLHVAVFNAIVHHLHKVAGAAFANPVTARFAGLGMRGNLLEDRLKRRPTPPAIRRASWTDRATPPLRRRKRRYRHRAARCFRPVSRGESCPENGYYAVDQNIALFEERHQLINQGVDCGAGLHQHHQLARPLQRSHKLLNAVAADKVLTGTAPGNKLIHLFHRAVEYRQP